MNTQLITAQNAQGKAGRDCYSSPRVSRQASHFDGLNERERSAGLSLVLPVRLFLAFVSTLLHAIRVCVVQADRDQRRTINFRGISSASLALVVFAGGTMVSTGAEAGDITCDAYRISDYNSHVQGGPGYFSVIAFRESDDDCISFNSGSGISLEGYITNVFSSRDWGLGNSNVYQGPVKVHWKNTNISNFKINGIAIPVATTTDLPSAADHKYVVTYTDSTNSIREVRFELSADHVTFVSTTLAVTTIIDPDLIRTRTKRVISNFMSRRADQITAGDPDLSTHLGKDSRAGNGSPINLAGAGTLDNNQLTFSTSLQQMVGASETAKAEKRRELGKVMALGQYSLGNSMDGDGTGFDVWVQGKWSHADSDTAKTDLGLLYVGAEYRFSPSLTVGFLTQFDWTDEDDKIVDVGANGRGWMAGPYLVSRLYDNLIFDGRVAWGQSDNEVNPFGTYTDSFDTDRWLVKGQFTGDFSMGNWHFAPHVGILYFEEKQKAYTDSLSVSIPGQTVSLGRMTFGPKVSYNFKAQDGTLISPHLGLKGIWDFQKADIVDLDTGAPTNSNDNLRARIEAGITASFANGWSLDGQGFYDGIGTNNLEAYGGSVKLTMPLN
jgi:outer membrane autotransporter protein